MSTDLQASVVLIASSDPKINRFGTGFVIHQDEQAAYLLTCAHVVDDVGGAETIDIGGLKATVVASGDADELDLAVLQVVEGLSDKSSLSLRVSGEKDNAFNTAGFQLFGRHYLIRPLQGKLGQPVGLAVRGQAGHIKAWDLKIEDDYQLQPGYSGSPVVDQVSGQVLGVVSHRQGQGERGLAISIEALPNIWPDMPADLFGKDESRQTTTQPGNTSPVEAQREFGGGPELSKPIKIFFSYAAKDEELRDELATHLTILKRQGKIEDWYEGDIDAGSERAAEIKAQLTSANIILLLVSPSFISSDHNYLQMQWAMTRRESGQAEVIPIILRPTTGWENETFGKLQPLPRGGTPVTSWPDRDEAFAHITEGILKVAEGLTKRSVASRQSAPTSTSAKSTAAVEPQASAVEYNTGAIRKLLRAAFSDEEFMIFCYDNFRDVHDQFSTGMSFTQKTQRLIEYCERNMAFETLLHLVEAENPAQYQRFASQVKL